jgi:hypothetical protein
MDKGEEGEKMLKRVLEKLPKQERMAAKRASLVVWAPKELESMFGYAMARELNLQELVDELTAKLSALGDAILQCCEAVVALADRMDLVESKKED